MSCNLKHFLGEISGVEFSEYLCRGILSIFLGRFLGTILANVYVLEFEGIAGVIYYNFFEKIFDCEH